MATECTHVRSEEIEGREYREVEGIIHQRADGVWIMPVPKVHGIDPDDFDNRRPVKSLMAPRVDYCPWCGAKLPEDPPDRENPHD